MNHIATIGQIRLLPWEKTEPRSIMVCAAFSALEFAASLRVGMQVDSRLGLIASGELDTDNLRFGEYSQKADHAEFLWFFIRQHNVLAGVDQKVIVAAGKYLAQVGSLSPEVRVMSVASREHELPAIFRRILPAIRDVQDDPALRAFRYYLERHIELDSKDGGHGDMLTDIKIDDHVDEFWKMRFEFFRSLFD